MAIASLAESLEHEKQPAPAGKVALGEDQLISAANISLVYGRHAQLDHLSVPQTRLLPSRFYLPLLPFHPFPLKLLMESQMTPSYAYNSNLILAKEIK
jgi:hypothetical protein